MINLNLLRKSGALRVLCVGAHSDDIEIGCGGTVLHLLKKYEPLEFSWVILSSDEKRKREAREASDAFLRNAAARRIMIREFKDGFFPYFGKHVKGFFEELKRKVEPDLIFTHYRFDLHQDHRLVSDLTWNTFRDHLILEYEIPKYDGDLGRPNLYVPLDEEICEKKISLILKCFKSQTGNHWFTEETFKSLLRLRGIESNASSRYAEAFHSRKAVLV